MQIVPRTTESKPSKPPALCDCIGGPDTCTGRCKPPAPKHNIGPKHLWFLEVGFLKPMARNPKARNA